jgi:hypothetical protein
VSRRLIVVAALTLVSTVSVPGVVAADPGDGLGTTDANSNPTSGHVAVAASRTEEGGRQAARSAPSRPVCTFSQWVTPPEAQAMIDAGASGGAVEAMQAQAAAADASLYVRSCPGPNGGEIQTWALVQNRVSIEDLISSATSRVTAQVPDPEMTMSPDPSVGGTVNVGLWLAVADPGQVSITASVGPVWATVTARYTSTAWDFGNGESVECDGLGTPIVDLDVIEQGPCGYTYRAPSAPEFTGTDDLAYHASVTGRWTVTFETSAGGSGTLSPIDRTSPFTYRVREIQTLRVADDG